MNPVGLRVLRWTSAFMVAVSMTAGSLVLVVWMNDDPSPMQHEAEHTGPRTIPVIAPPPPPTPTPLSSSSSMSAVGAASTPAPSVAPPAAAPPQIAGLAPSPGPGGMPLGRVGSSLPSMGTLPGSDLSEVPETTQTTQARPRSRPKPRYPRIAQRQGIEGFVTLRLRIDATGRVEDAVVVKSEPGGVFDDAALQTARRYRFMPARRGGDPIATTLEQTIRFELQR